MGKLESTLKSEIERLAKREIRSTFVPIRREVRTMRLKLSSLSKNFSVLNRQAKEQLQKVPKRGLEVTPEFWLRSKGYIKVSINPKVSPNLFPILGLLVVLEKIPNLAYMNTAHELGSKLIKNLYFNGISFDRTQMLLMEPMMPDLVSFSRPPTGLMNSRRYKKMEGFLSEA